MAGIPKRKLNAPSRTEYHRMNFLLQASNLMMKQFSKAKPETVSSPTTTPSQSSAHSAGEGRDQAMEVEVGNDNSSQLKYTNSSRKIFTLREVNLSRNLTLQARQVAKKAVLRIDPVTKRQICRKCSLQLSPGLTCTVRFRRDKSKKLFKSTTCLSCGFCYRLPIDASHELRSESGHATEEELS